MKNAVLKTHSMSFLPPEDSQSKQNKSSVGSWVMLCSLLSNHLCGWNPIYVTQADIWELKSFYTVCLVTLAWISRNLSQKLQRWETKQSARLPWMNSSFSLGLVESLKVVQVYNSNKQHKQTWYFILTNGATVTWKYLSHLTTERNTPSLSTRTKKDQDGDNSSYRCLHLAKIEAQTTVGTS